MNYCIYLLPVAIGFLYQYCFSYRSFLSWLCRPFTLLLLILTSTVIQILLFVVFTVLSTSGN